MGDPAESILNTISGIPIPVAYGQRNSLSRSQLPSGDFSYGLADPITTRLLQPGEAFVVPNDSTRPSPTDPSQREVEPNYHTYWIPDAEHPVPVVLWTHPQRPKGGGPGF